MGNRSVNDSERTILRSQARSVIVVAYVAAITECTVSSSQECVRLIRHKIVPVDAVKEILEIHELLRARSIEIALPPLREGPDLSIAVHVSSQRDLSAPGEVERKLPAAQPQNTHRSKSATSS